MALACAHITLDCEIHRVIRATPGAKRFMHASFFLSLSQGEERARIPAEFRVRSFKPVTG